MGPEKSSLSSRQKCPPHRGWGHTTSKIPPNPHDFLIFKSQDDSRIPMVFFWSFSPPPPPSSLIKELHHLLFLRPPPCSSLTGCFSLALTGCETTYLKVQSFPNQALGWRRQLLHLFSSSAPALCLKSLFSFSFFFLNGFSEILFKI